IRHCRIVCSAPRLHGPSGGKQSVAEAPVTVSRSRSAHFRIAARIVVDSMQPAVRACASGSGSVLHSRPWAEDLGRHRETKAMTSLNSFSSRATLDVARKPYTIYRLDALSAASGGNSDKLPFSLKILLENLLRNEDGAF